MALPAEAVTVGRAHRRAAFQSVRAFTESLAAPLGPEDQTVQSMPDVSPTKWHRAHTSWFFETFILGPAGVDAFDPAYAYLFNSYYDGVGPRHARHERGLLSRPGVEDITRYRRHVDGRMLELLERELDPATDDLVTLGLHHEQQHQELLLMDIKHVLSRSPLRPAYDPHPAWRAAAPATDRWVAFPGGIAEIGARGDGFAFDNESPRHRVVLEPYALRATPATCGEWLAFIDDGGYRRPELWLSEGWATVEAQGWDAPLYWSRDGEGWSVFTLSGPKPVDPDEPVCHISYFEADAFAHWSRARLPTEAEWETAAETEIPTPVSHALHPRATRDGARLHGLFGQVWQWTMSAYAPYPGFRPAAGAVGEYNGKFMVNQQTLRGGCCVTPVGHSRSTYRNFFPAAARWPFTGVRLARDEPQGDRR